MSINFNASVFVSEQLNRLMVNTAQELAQRAVNACAEQYNFDAEEAIRLLGLRNVKLERKESAKGKEVKNVKVEMPKPKFPLPYNGEFNDAYCYALRQNNGLYTQCSGGRKGDAQFCKGCVKLMQKTGSDVPEYGTIQQRQAVGIFEYVDPKGRKPIAYTKMMKKLKINEEEVREEAGKFSIILDDNHFITTEDEKKRGRRASKKEKEEKPKGTKGRPKKERKVLLIEGDDDDLFAALVEEANVEDDNSSKKKGLSDEEKAEKAAKKEQERLEREAKKRAEEEEKAAKAAKKEQERLEREAKKKAEEEEKERKRKEKEEKSSKKVTKEIKKDEEEEEEEEPDVVKKIEYQGKKYLKSKKTGVIYDYAMYKKDGEQVKIGMWNEKSNKIDFDDDEESEEEYDM
jgi:hypothetical protein